MHNKSWTLLICFCTLLTGIAAAQIFDENLTRCKGDDPELKISGCTAVIASAVPDETLATAFYRRGVAYHNKRQNDRAIQDYDQAIRLHPSFADAFYNRGLAYSGKGRYDRAIPDYDEAIRLNPNYALAFLNRGNAYVAIAMHEAGMQNYHQVIRPKPDQRPGFFKGYDRAIEDYDQAIRLNPNLAEAFHHRGAVYSAEGEFDRAIQDYDQAIRLKPSYAEAWYGRGFTKSLLDDKAGAATDFAKAQQLDPTLKPPSN